MNQNDIEGIKQEIKDTTNTNTENISDTSITLNLKDYEEYMAYKKAQESTSSQLSINDGILRELAYAQAREEQE